MSEIAADAEDLLLRLRASDSPESTRLRMRIEAGLHAMRVAFRATMQAQEVAPALTQGRRPSHGYYIMALAFLSLALLIRHVRR